MKKTIWTFLIISMCINGFFMYHVYNENKRISKLEESIIFLSARELYNEFDDFNYDLIQDDKYLKKDKEYIRESLIKMESRTMDISSYYFLNKDDIIISDKKCLKDLFRVHGYFARISYEYLYDKPLDKQGINKLKEIMHKGGMVGTIIDSAENYDKRFSTITPIENLKGTIAELGDMCKKERDRLEKISK